MPGTLRYWNGAEWTEHVAPSASQQSAAPVSSTTEATAWVTAVLVPIVGAALAIVLLTKGQRRGAGILAVSLMAALFWLFYFG